MKDLLSPETRRTLDLKYARRDAGIAQLKNGWAVDSAGAISGLIATGLKTEWDALERSLQYAEKYNLKRRIAAIEKVMALLC